MKILYITPTIYDAGGVARVLALKSKYLVNNCHFEVCFLTNNNEDVNCFYSFPDEIIVKDIKVKGFKPIKILNYFKQLNLQIKEMNPDVVVICDFGWKGFCHNLFVKLKVPTIFEIHGARFNETKQIKYRGVIIFRAFLRKQLLKTFKNRVFLSKESVNEWMLKGEIIPNPIEVNLSEQAKLNSKRLICVARHSYEKGIDRLIKIWAKIIEKKHDWVLDIYGNGIYFKKNKELANSLNINDKINFYPPTQNIFNEYLQSSILLMASRQEGFGMVLLEAMSVGLPVVAYDCPVGPRSIIKNGYSGYLIQDNDEDAFVAKVIELQNDFELRKKIGQNAMTQMSAYDLGVIGQKWKEYFTSLTSKS